MKKPDQLQKCRGGFFGVKRHVYLHEDIKMCIFIQINIGTYLFTPKNPPLVTVNKNYRDHFDIGLLMVVFADPNPRFWFRNAGHRTDPVAYPDLFSPFNAKI